ncbi:hypothetical protein IKQ21_06495 [bacterium]|nr:hypothetical protein [bacterium]
MFSRVHNINININGSRYNPCWGFPSFYSGCCGFPPVPFFAPGFFSPMNLACYNAGSLLGNYAAGKVMSFLC